LEEEREEIAEAEAELEEIAEAEGNVADNEAYIAQ